MIRCLGKIIYVGGFKPLNKAMRWQHVILHVEEKGLKISEGCKHDWESRGIKGTAPSTGLRACSFPCCSEQWMRDNWEAEHHHLILHFSLSLCDLICHVLCQPCDWHQGLSHRNWTQKKWTEYLSLLLNLVTPNTMGQTPSCWNQKIFLYWAVKSALTCQISSVLLVSIFLLKW